MFLNSKVSLFFTLVSVVAFSAQAQEKMEIGKFKSRVIYQAASHCPAPLVIMTPGSGSHGPEEMMPGSMTADGKEHSIFAAFSEGLVKGGVGTLAVGKPGIEFFSSFAPETWTYDKNLYAQLGWQDLIDNVKEAVSAAQQMPCVDKNRIYILGHSEGTQVAIDLARQNPGLVQGLILVGFSGEPLAEVLDWQLFRRAIDLFISPDVDSNHDGVVTQEEGRLWPDFQFPWSPALMSISLFDLEKMLRQVPALQQEYAKASQALIWQGVFNRAPIYPEAAALKEDIYVFTGSVDAQTRPEDALKLQAECVKVQKKNCWVQIVPGFGHAMSEPTGPRHHPLLDLNLGPVDERFKDILQNWAVSVSAPKF